MASTRGKTQTKRGAAKKSAARKTTAARPAKTGARRAPRSEAAYRTGTRTREPVDPYVAEVREAIDAAVAQGKELRKGIESRIRTQFKGMKK